jgi:malate permease and related proteins
MLIRLLLSLWLFVGAMLAGWWMHRRGWLPEARAARLVRWLVILPSPVVLCLSFWHMSFRSFEPWILPLLGLAIAASTLAPAHWYVRASRMTRPQAGSFLTCAFFSNLGYFGAFTAFALYGETAYALCALYFVYFTPAFYTLGFSTAARYGDRTASSAAMTGAYNAELRIFPLLGMIAGALLSLAGVPRPAPLEWLNHALIPVNTAVYLATIGAQLTFSSPRPWMRHCLAMCAIKFLYTPLVAWVLATACRIEGLPRIVVLLEAATPVAVSPLILPLLFGLDRRFANALWLVTTLVGVPVYLILLPLLPRL